MEVTDPVPTELYGSATLIISRSDNKCQNDNLLFQNQQQDRGEESVPPQQQEAVRPGI
jgi:hypothetical protein